MKDAIQVFDSERISRAEDGVTCRVFPSDYTLADVAKHAHPAAFILRDEGLAEALLSLALRRVIYTKQ